MVGGGAPLRPPPSLKIVLASFFFPLNALHEGIGVVEEEEEVEGRESDVEIEAEAPRVQATLHQPQIPHLLPGGVWWGKAAPLLVAGCKGTC